LPKYFGQRGAALAQYLRLFWLRLGKTVLQLFHVDLHSHAAYKSLGQWSYECVLTKAVLEDGPLHQGPEKTKPFYRDLYRLSAHGGFMYLARCQLEAGAALHPENASSPPAVSVSEYDLNSAYGYSGGSCRLPGGFCVGYLKPSLRIRPNGVDDHREFDVATPRAGETLLRADRYRHDGFEFRATYFVIDQLQQNPESRVAHAWHNYSSLGLAFVGPYPLDLMVVTELGNLLCYQFDGIFFHGCERCPRLPRYAAGRGLEETLERTGQRDAEIRNWVAKIPGATYEVLTDCHHLTRPLLTTAFRRNPRLAALRGCYPCHSSLSRERFLEWGVANRHDQNHTYGAWVAARARQPSFMVPRPNVACGDDLLADTGSQRVALVREYFEELQDRQSLELVELDAVLFYRTWPSLGRVYRTLTQRRCETRDPVEADFLKKFVNLSCGYMGLRENGGAGRVQHHLTDGGPQRYNMARHFYDYSILENRFTHLGQTFVYLATLRISKKVEGAPLRPCRAALPLYFFVVEHAKLRLLEFLHAVAQHVSPADWKLLYSNVDNVVVATSAPSLTEAVRDVDARRVFEEALSTFVSRAKLPGLFKLEWCYNDATWKLVTSRIMELALLSDTREDHYRRSGPGTADPRLGYENALQTLGQLRSRFRRSTYADRYI